MLNIPRLRDVLKKLETTSDLARILIKRTCIACDDAEVTNKEHEALASSDKPPTNGTGWSTSLTRIGSVTSQSSSLASPLTTPLARVVGIGYGRKAPPGTNEIKLMMYNNYNTNNHTQHEKNQPKTIRAALFNASLFSRAASNGYGGGAVILELSNTNCIDSRKEGALNQQQKNFDQNQTAQTEQQKQDQSSHNMSEAKVKEEVIVVTQQHQHQGEATTKQLDETTTKVSCNGASCGSGEKSGGKEKSCFQSSLPDIIHFMELVGNLKHTKRTGWVLRDVNDCESISGHMYRMSIMTFLLEDTEGLNRIRCMELALVHDLAESLVGDLTPFCGVAKEDKKAMELKAMADICKLVEPRGQRIMELFEEYEEGQSAESKFVKDLDRLDMVMQAFEYEKRDNCLMKHQEFFDSTEGKFQHPFIQKLVKEICDQRKSLVEANIVANGELKLKTVTPNCPPCLEHKMEHKNERS